MSCSACLICVLVILVINSKISVASCNVENQKCIDILNALLTNSGWKEVQTKYGSEFISGQDITNNNDLNIEISKNVIVNAENFTAKYIQTIQLLACVYADVLLNLINNLTYMLLVISEERCNIRSTLYRIRKSSLKKRKRLDDEQQALTEACVIGQTGGMENKSLDLDDKISDQACEEIKDYKKSWELINVVLKKFKSLWLVFEYISGAMSYLVDLVPLCYKTQDAIKKHIIICADELKNKSKDIQLLLPRYKGENDIYYNKQAGKFTGKALRFFKRLMELFLRPFIRDSCTSLEFDTLGISELISSYKKLFHENSLKIRTKVLQKTDIIMCDLDMKIDYIANYVVKNGYSDLGFKYDEINQKTSVLRLS